MLEIKNLHVEVDEKEIIKGINMKIEEGEKVFILGPNGSGKTTLALSIAGHPKYKITKGNIYFNKKEIKNLPANERNKMGIFVCMQNPIEIEGVSLINLLQSRWKNIETIENEVNKILEKLNLGKEFVFRDLNVGLSGGERKKSEILQLAILKPKLAILDEFDTGLDVDSLKHVCKIINEMFDEKTSFLIITHYTRILKYIEPSKVKVMINGRIVDEGNKELVKKIEKFGYQSLYNIGI